MSIYTVPVCDDGSCSKRKCESCTLHQEISKVIKSEPIITPFYREIGVDFPDGCQPLPRWNYKPYDLFCLQTKMEPFIYKLNPKYSIKFLSYEFEGNMRVFFDLMKAGEFIPINKENSLLIQKELDKQYNKYPDHCLLIDSDHVISGLSPTWVSSILPFVALDVDMILDSSDTSTRILIKLDPDSPYAGTHEIIRTNLYSKLYGMYNSGIIPLDPVLNKSFIRDWGLIEVDNSEGDDALLEAKIYRESIDNNQVDGWPGESTILVDTDELDELLDVIENVTDERIADGSYLLYKPIWNDSRLASDRILFLLERMSNMKNNLIGIDISLGNFTTNFWRRHLVSKILQLKGIKHIFSRNFVYFSASNIGRALYISDNIASGLSGDLSEIFGNNNVFTMNLVDPSDFEVVRKTIINTEINNEKLLKNSDVIMYATDKDIILSFTIPLEVDYESFVRNYSGITL
jgi:hypothetical protein